MSKIAFIFAVGTVILCILNIILDWDNSAAVSGWFVALLGWIQLIILHKKV